MALTPEQEQRRLELIQKQNEAAKELASTYERMARTAKGLNDSEKETLNLSKKIAEMSSNIEKAISKRLDKTSSVKDISKAIQSIEQSSIKNANIAKELDKKRLEAQQTFQKLDNKRIDLLRQLTDAQGLADKKDRELIEKEAELAILSNSRLKVDRDRAKQLSQEVTNLRISSRETQRALADKQKQVDLAEKAAAEQYNITEQIQKSVKANEAINKEAEKEIELLKKAKALREAKSLLDALGEKFDTKKIKDMATIGGLFKVMLESALKFNEISVQTSKNLGYGASEANRVTQNLVNVAQTSRNINVTLKNAGEAMNELNTATGLVAEYSGDTLETQIMLTKQFGLQADEAAGIYKFSVLNSKSSSDTNKAMVSAFVAARNSLRVGANFKQVMAEAAKVSGQLAANLGYSPERITKAVVAMKAFGTTLEQTKAQGDALLNFESSLESELKAELLTGEQINLERARAAALAGDQVALAEELANQGMTLNKFQGMNVLAQKAYAEALGLSADQLSDQLQKQKLAAESGKSLAQITEEEALKAQERQTIQDKFNNAILKLQDLIGNLVAGPLSWFLDIFSTAAPIIAGIATIYGTIYTLSKGIALFENLKLGYQVAQKGAALGYNGILLARQAIMKGELTKAIGIAAAYAVANPFTALAGLGVAAAVGTLIYNITKADDMIQPGYGKRTLLSPEGSIALNDKDTVIAGTNLGGGEGNIAPSIDLTPMIAAINSVRESVDRLYSKDTSVNMDGKKVGSTLTQGSYKVA